MKWAVWVTTATAANPPQQRATPARAPHQGLQEAEPVSEGYAYKFLSIFPVNQTRCMYFYFILLIEFDLWIFTSSCNTMDDGTY